MDAEAFLAAQLWLHALPPSAWPGESGKVVAAAASSGRDFSKVILYDARCCLLLDAIWPTAYGRGTSKNGALDGVATSRRHRQLRFLPSRKNARESLSGRTGSFHESFHASKGGKRGGGGDGTRGESPLPESVVDFIAEFDFGLAIVRGTGSDGEGAASAAGEHLGEACSGATKETPAARTDGSRPRDSVGGSGVLLLRIDDRVYQAEHTLIERIAYPKSGSGLRSNGGDGVGHRGPQNGNPQHGRGVPSSTALPREEEESTSARHFGGDPVPVGVGGVARTKKRKPDASTCAPQADSACSRGGGGDNSGCGTGFMTKRRESSSTFAAAGGRDGGIAVTAVAGAKKKKKLGARDEKVDPTRNAEDGRRSRWDTDGGGGGGGGGGEDSGRGSPPSPHRGGLPAGHCRRAQGSARHTDVCSCCCDDVEGRAAMTEGRTKTGACCSGRGGGEGGCDCDGVESESPTVGSSGDRGDVFGAGNNNGETPYCGLLFPGVVLKFWLPRRRGGADPACSGSGARLEAVERLQGVVTEIMRGLSSSTRAHPLAMATGAMGQVPNFGSPPPPGPKESGLGSDGSRNRRAAWDEFVYGTHVLLSLEHEHEQEQVRGDDQENGCDDVGVGGCRCCEGRAKLSSAAKKRTRSKADGIGWGSGGNQPPCILSRGPFERSGSGWEWEAGSYDGGPSDLGQRRALATLAECFSRARVPWTARSTVKPQLQAAEISAERALEDALDRAFPQDLSQRRDSDSRNSTGAELEACCARARAARESLLPLDLLPAPEMLREAN